MTTLKNLELQSLVKESVRSDAALFDTAERYGSHLKTALGVSFAFFLIIQYAHDHVHK